MIIHKDVASVMKMLENNCSRKAFLNCICIICPIIYVFQLLYIRMEAPNALITQELLKLLKPEG